MGRFHLVVRCCVFVAGIAASGLASAQPGLPGLPGGGATTVTGPLEMSCDGVDAIACQSVGRLEYVGICDDDDSDGVCNSDDRCSDTPADMPVFLDGCHLTADQPAVLTGVRFEFDSARLRPESRAVLDQAVAVLSEQTGVYVSIDGHTDAKGGEAYNQRLSYARARSVFDYFRAAGIDTARLVYRGFGESRPVAPNQLDDGSDNPAGRALNRRVELTVVDEIEFQSIRSDNEARAASPSPVIQEPEAEPPYEVEEGVELEVAEEEASAEEDEISAEASESRDAQAPAEQESVTQEDAVTQEDEALESSSEDESADIEPMDDEIETAGADESAETGSESSESARSASDEAGSDNADADAGPQQENDDYGEWDDLDYLN